MSGGVLNAQYLPQGKEKLLLRDILSFKRRRSLPPPALALLWQNRTKQILRWNHQADELQLPTSLKPVKALSQMTPTWK